VREHLKGKPTASEVVIRVPGGEVDDMGLAVSDAPWFDPGEDVLVFLTPELKGARWWAHQGKLTIKTARSRSSTSVGEV
jgi:hypothetical protein